MTIGMIEVLGPDFNLKARPSVFECFAEAEEEHKASYEARGSKGAFMQSQADYGAALDRWIAEGNRFSHKQRHPETNQSIASVIAEKTGLAGLRKAHKKKGVRCTAQGRDDEGASDLMMLLSKGGFEGLGLYLDTVDMKTARKMTVEKNGKKEKVKSPFNSNAYFTQSDVNELVYVAQCAGIDGLRMFFDNGGMVKNGAAGCMGKTELHGLMKAFQGSDNDSLLAMTMYLQRPGAGFDFDNRQEREFFLSHRSKEIKGIYEGAYYRQTGKFPSPGL